MQAITTGEMLIIHYQNKQGTKNTCTLANAPKKALIKTLDDI